MCNSEEQNRQSSSEHEELGVSVRRRCLAGLLPWAGKISSVSLWKRSWVSLFEKELEKLGQITAPWGRFYCDLPVLTRANFRNKEPGFLVIFAVKEVNDATGFIGTRSMGELKKRWKLWQRRLQQDTAQLGCVLFVCVLVCVCVCWCGWERERELFPPKYCDIEN